ncbi:MAG: hypothetical protein LBL47_04750, partial [Lactobacillus sp.]|nr:hypothetical protein [Lactobacillus sp.]
MVCTVFEICGGCSYRDLGFEEYSKRKKENFAKALSHINQDNINFGEPIFIPDGCRRRAFFSFEYKKKKLTFGFNQSKTNMIVDIDACPLLTPKLSGVIPALKNLLAEICFVQIQEKNKKKKIVFSNVSSGSVFACEADNGIDI